ncbi:hypothetical protein [Rhodobacteraceae bacterium DSL-40]|uniref:hypothetical protein n=1 Tax=Amaricoccus sp. B4 TaxID=3368557 RepID=UPI000DABD137
MKQADLQACAPCVKGMMHVGASFFCRGEIGQMVVDLKVVQRQAGLEMEFGGRIAGALDPDEELAVEVRSRKALVCSDCALGERMLLAVPLEE